MLGETGGPYPDKYKLIDLNVNPFRYHFADTFGYCFEKLDYLEDTISYNNFGLNLNALTERYFSMTSGHETYFPFSNAFACDPAPPQSSEMIISLQIFCDKDFDENHPTGTDISDLFDVVVPLSHTPTAYKQCDNMKDLQSLDSYITENPFSFRYIDLALNSPPLESDSYTFTIKYNQDGIDLDYIEIESPIVLLKP